MVWLLHKAALAFVLTARDVVGVGLWHPRLLVWRIQLWLLRSRQSRAGAFEAALRSRQNGQPATAYTQGDTPWMVLREAAGWLALEPGVTLVDVGAGNGVAAAVLCALSGSQVYAVEPLAPLRAQAQRVHAGMGLKIITVAQVQDVPLWSTRAALACWTCWDAAAREALTAQLASMPQDARLVTLTHPATGPGFALCGQVRRLFPFGWVDVYVHVRT